MKKVYFSKAILGKYLFSETPIERVSERKNFNNLDSLIDYLASSETKKLRKRGNLLPVFQGIETKEEQEIVTKMKDLGYRVVRYK